MEIIVAIITSGVGLIGTIIAVIVSAKSQTDKLTADLDKRQAVTDAKIEQMKEDIREHNHYAKLFAESMPVVKEQIKVLNHRVSDLENERKAI